MNTASSDDQHESIMQPDMPLGLRLRQAREIKGMSVCDVAEKLRLKSATVEALEREDIDALGAPVYARGYFSSYARLVDLPVVLVDRTFSRRAEPAPIPLSSPARTSHSRYLFDRYAKRAVYVVLTASIVVPVILLATRDQLPRPGATLTPLDSPSQVETTRQSGDPVQSSSAQSPPAGDAVEMGPPVSVPPAPRSAAENPVIASLTPFYPAATTVPAIAPPAAVESTGLSLHFSGDSWVEIVGHDGARLEFGVLRAGTVRRFDASKVARVSLGNASAVEVRMNGSVTDIAPFRRANVARFTVSSQGSLAPAGG